MFYDERNLQWTKFPLKKLCKNCGFVFDLIVRVSSSYLRYVNISNLRYVNINNLYYVKINNLHNVMLRYRILLLTTTTAALTSWTTLSREPNRSALTPSYISTER